jgi:hypothetical protein
VSFGFKQNLFFAFAYNAAGISIAAGVLYRAFGLLLSPMIAAAGDEFKLGVCGQQRAPIGGKSRSRFVRR